MILNFTYTCDFGLWFCLGVLFTKTLPVPEGHCSTSGAEWIGGGQRTAIRPSFTRRARDALPLPYRPKAPARGLFHARNCQGPRRGWPMSGEAKTREGPYP
jgi:hypothetical protein